MNSEVVLDRPPERIGNGSKRFKAVNRSIARLIALLGRVGEWMRENASRVKKVYFVAIDDGFKLYAIPQSSEHDSELTRLLCDFIVQLGDDGYDAHCSQIPDGTPDELAAFFDPAQALLLSTR